MSYLYVNEQGASISVKENRIEVSCNNSLTKSIPIETIESIQVFGNVILTNRCINVCLTKGIDVIFYSKKGSYYGRLISTNHVNVKRQRIQAKIYDNEKFRVEFSKRIVSAKIRNQITIMRRYGKENPNTEYAISMMKRMLVGLEKSTTIAEVMGNEGTAAKFYFKILGEIVPEEFTFEKRSKKPPRDEFNAMISFGYSILLNELYGKIEGRGLNPFFGIMHSDREKHPSLASDLMEEWRAVIVDSTVLSLVCGKEIRVSDFYREDGGVFLTDNGLKIFAKKLEKKMNTTHRYFDAIEYNISYRRSLDVQVGNLIKAMEEEDVLLYSPILIR